jgi:hypothetical protein
MSELFEHVTVLSLIGSVVSKTEVNRKSTNKTKKRQKVKTKSKKV